MRKPMTDFVTRGGLGELLAAATAIIDSYDKYDRSRGAQEVASDAIQRLWRAVEDGIRARKEEADAASNGGVECKACPRVFLPLRCGPRANGFCSSD